MRRIQVTAVWETQMLDKDGIVTHPDLLAEAVLYQRDIGRTEALSPTENCRVDVQLMPRTQHAPGEIIQTDDPVAETEKLRQSEPGRTQFYIFPADHPLAAIERAYCDTDGDMEAVEQAMREVIYDKCLKDGARSLFPDGPRQLGLGD